MYPLLKYCQRLVLFATFISCLFITDKLHVSKAYAFDSMLEFENQATSSGGFSYLGSLSNCFSTDQVAYPWEYGAFNNTCLPSILSKTKVTCSNTSTSTWAFAATVGRGVVYYNMLTAFPVGTLLAFLAMGIEYVIMVDLCTNAYIVAPHEYINLENDKMDCQAEAGIYFNRAEGALTSTDVPFFYHCDPNYDPISGQTLQPGNNDDAELIGRTWGYMGAASPYCAGEAEANARKDMIGKAVVHYISGWDRFWSGISNRCQKGGEGSPTRHAIHITPGKDEYMMPAHYHAYYRFNSGVGKLQMCVVTPWTLLPIKVGCTYVPPPSEDDNIDQFLVNYVSGTRCYYFLTSRTDLATLGKALAETDENGHSGKAIKGFLGSDLHIVSTVVGCLQDMLVKVFINPQDTQGNYGKPFFQLVQERLKTIVFAALVLYISLVAIKLMSSPQPPTRPELLMYVLKFVLALYFTTGDVWYKPNPKDPQSTATGLYTALIDASTEIAGFFMAAQNDNDPIGFCRYQFQGASLLDNRDLAPGALGNAVEPTIGQKPPVLKLTVWDLIDCKLINYLNFGSCKYSLTGMIGVWIISAAFFAGVKGFLLSIISFTYCFLLLLVIFKFIHIFILSLFTIMILVLLAPIFISFALFEYTKGIFQKWMSMILGYMIYPGLLFAFIALMLMTFDSVFFGDLDIKGGQTSVKEACIGVKSIYCATYDALNDDPCSANVGNIGSKLTETLNLGPLGKFTILKSSFAEAYLDAVLKLMLFAFLFYMFMGSVSSFLSILTGVYDLGEIAKGSLDLGQMVKSVASAGASKARSGVSKLFKSGGGKSGG